MYITTSWNLLINSNLNNELSIGEVVNLLLRHWDRTEKIEYVKLSKRALNEVVENNKYQSLDWNFAWTPKFNVKNKSDFQVAQLSLLAVFSSYE